MKANMKLVLAFVLFVISVASSVFPHIASAAGCPQEGNFLKSDGTWWACKLKSEASDSCTYYNVNTSTHSDECWKQAGEELLN